VEGRKGSDNILNAPWVIQSINITVGNHLLLPPSFLNEGNCILGPEAADVDAPGISLGILSFTTGSRMANNRFELTDAVSFISLKSYWPVLSFIKLVQQGKHGAHP
jgi:hypothetical protein